MSDKSILDAYVKERPSFANMVKSPHQLNVNTEYLFHYCLVQPPKDENAHKKCLKIVERLRVLGKPTSKYVLVQLLKDNGQPKDKPYNLYFNACNLGTTATKQWHHYSHLEFITQ